MKFRILIAIAIILVFGGIGALFYSVIFPTAVPVVQVESRDIVETLVATGQIERRTQTAVTAETAASVTTVEVEEGDRVDDGEILIQLDDDQGQLAIDQAEAAVAEARARLRSVVDQSAPTSMQELNQATLNLEAAEQEYQRAQQLLDAGVITRAEVDERRREVDRARTEVERAQTAAEQTEPDGSAYDEAAAMLRRAEAERSLAEYQLTFYTVRASEEATVLTLEVEPGEAVQPGTVLAITGSGPTEVVLAPDERELGSLEVNQSAIVIADAFPDQTFAAHLRHIDPTIDPERGTITVRLQVEEPPPFLRTGMTVIADIELARRDDALVIAREAVRNLATDEPSVVIGVEGRAEEIDVKTGLVDDDYVEIIQGLEAGDIVVATPDVEPGDRIRRGTMITPNRGGES